MNRYIVYVQFLLGSMAYKSYEAKNVTELIRITNENSETVLFIDRVERL